MTSHLQWATPFKKKHWAVAQSAYRSVSVVLGLGQIWNAAGGFGGPAL